MENSNFYIDEKSLNIYKLMQYLRNINKINEDKDKLYKITQNYLKSMGADSDFLDKPAVIERVKNILFNNLLLGEKTKIFKDSIVEKNGDFFQKLMVLNDGSIAFVKSKNTEVRSLKFEKNENEIKCKYTEFDGDIDQSNTANIYIDEYGFDKKCIIDFVDREDEENIEEICRENFCSLIDSLKGENLVAFEDWGNHSIAVRIDNIFMHRNDTPIISEDEYLLDNMIEKIQVSEDCYCYPVNYLIVDSESIGKIRNNYNYYVSKYPNAKRWFFDKYGYDFLRNNGIIEQSELNIEKNVMEKILKAPEYEVIQRFEKIKFEPEYLKKIGEYLYSYDEFVKAQYFLNKLSDEEKMNFVNETNIDEPLFIARIISLINNDEMKDDLLKSMDDDLKLNGKIDIIVSYENQGRKFELLDELLDEIIEEDDNVLEQYNTGDYEVEQLDFLSERILDNTFDSEDLYYFLTAFAKYPIIKSSYLEQYSSKELQDLLDSAEENACIENYIEFLKTGKLEDDYIINLLEKNWDDNFEFSNSDEITVIDEYYDFSELEYTFKSFALIKVDDDEKRIKFLEEHIEDFEEEEICIVLEEVENDEKMLALARKYEINSSKYYHLVSLCNQNIKLDCLENDKELDFENMVEIVASLDDVKKAIRYIMKKQDLNIIQKMEIMNNLLITEDEMEFAKKVKKQFLLENKEELKGLTESADLEVLQKFASEFWDDGSVLDKFDDEVSFE